MSAGSWAVGNSSAVDSFYAHTAPRISGRVEEVPFHFLFENLPDMEIQTHPERLKQMLPWGKLIQEKFA